MAENSKELIKVLASLADEENIYVTAKKSAFETVLDLADTLADDSDSDILDFFGVSGAPKRLSYVLSHKLSKKKRLQLANQVTKAIDVDSSKVPEIILKDRQMKTVALSTLRTFIEDRTDFTIDKPSDDCSIL